MDMPLQSQGPAAAVRAALPAERQPSVAFFGRELAVPVGWLVILLLLLLEWALFVQFANRELLGAYPTSLRSVRIPEPGLRNFRPHYQGRACGGIAARIAHETAAGQDDAPSGRPAVAGRRAESPDRAFHQLPLLRPVAVSRRIHAAVADAKRGRSAFLGLGLLLTTRSRFLLAGGMADFRLDNIAFCLFGVFVCLAVRSGRVCLEALVAGGGACGGLADSVPLSNGADHGGFAGCSARDFLSDRVAQQGRGIEEGGVGARARLGVSGLLIAAIILPAIWLAREELRAYYIGQAMTGPKIRAAELGATGTFSYWTFYARSLIFDHLGGICCALALVVVVVLFFAARLRPRDWDDETDAGTGFPFTLLFLAVMFFIPLLILTAYPVRNPIVANILITPALGLIISRGRGVRGPEQGGRPTGCFGHSGGTCRIDVRIVASLRNWPWLPAARI